jgi:carbamoyl-phosphate synthase large subunit
MKNFRQSAAPGSNLVAVDNSPYAPALYLADKQYVVPRIDAPEYIDRLIDICMKEHIQAITTFIDPEIELLAKSRTRFSEIGVEVLVPYENTAHICFDKYLLFKYFKENGIRTVMTWGTIEEFEKDLTNGTTTFPVFVKPRTGSSSVGARKVNAYEQLKVAVNADSSLIIQEYMNCIDIDVDVYIDTISHNAVSAFSKKKIATIIGGASKTISFRDPVLSDFVRKCVSIMNFYGPIDIDLFYKDGQYYLSEINPRFGGAYVHAYSAGVDFIKLIENNLRGIENMPNFDNYEEGVVMMMYDSVVIKMPGEIAED